jgi:HPt (histidine-containing phosphotransfer) domain-containing protein
MHNGMEHGTSPYGMAARDKQDLSGTWRPPKHLQDLAAAGCDTLMPELIAVFRADTDSRLRAIEQALENADLALVRHHTHAVKGGARQMGAIAMASVCEEMETLAAGAEPLELRRLLSTLSALFERVLAEMSVYA